MPEKKYKCEYIEDVTIDEKSVDYKKYCAIRKDRVVYEEGVIKKFYDEHLFRKSLKCKISDGCGSIVVILMNPSYADEYNLDSTLNNVKKYLEQRSFAKFEILNIFPIRMPNSDNVDGLMKKYDKKGGKYQKENYEYIVNVLEKEENEDILIAWGSKYHNNKNAQEVLKFLKSLKSLKDKKNKNLYVYRLNKDSSPSHFAPQVYNRHNKVYPGSKMIPIRINKTENGKYIIIENKNSVK